MSWWSWTLNLEKCFWFSYLLLALFLIPTLDPILMPCFPCCLASVLGISLPQRGCSLDAPWAVYTWCGVIQSHEQLVLGVAHLCYCRTTPGFLAGGLRQSWRCTYMSVCSSVPKQIIASQHRITCCSEGLNRILKRHSFNAFQDQSAIFSLGANKRKLSWNMSLLPCKFDFHTAQILPCRYNLQEYHEQLDLFYYFTPEDL